MFTIRELLTSSSIIDLMYSDGTAVINCDDIGVNDYVILRDKDADRSTLARHMGEGAFVPTISRRSPNICGIQPKDSKQAAFLDSLINKNILVSIAVGSAGTGKTTLALAYAADQWQNENKPIYLCKPTVRVGNTDAFGTVPGDVQEKYDPYLASYKIVLKKIFGESAEMFFAQMQKKGDLQYVPIELARGCTYENCTFIVDEVQNLTWHELNTIVSRMGENTKLILLGDLNQIDSEMPRNETGIYKFVTSKAFINSKISSAIKLKTQYRSPITQLVADVDNEIRNLGELANSKLRKTKRNNEQQRERICAK